MSWRITSRISDRWVSYSGGRFDADEETWVLLAMRADSPAAYFPGGPWYEPKRPGDEVAIFMHARNLVPAPIVAGNPPDVPPPPPYAAPDGALF